MITGGGGVQKVETGDKGRRSARGGREVQRGDEMGRG